MIDAMSRDLPLIPVIRKTVASPEATRHGGFIKKRWSSWIPEAEMRWKENSEKSK
jgi:hypothetical protein